MSFSEHIMWCLRKHPETGEKIKVFGLLRLPAGAESTVFTHITYPTVVLAHGIGSTHASLDDIAEELSSHGVVTYAIDFCGGGVGSKSDGDPLEMTVESEVRDLAAAVQLMTEEPFCDTANISLVGESQGGLVCAAYAERHPEQIKSMALLYPAFCVHDDALGAYPEESSVPDACPTRAGVTVGRPYVLDAQRNDPYEHMGSFDRDVLIIHGDEDSLVDPAYSRRAVRTFPKAELEIVRGAGHGFAGEDRERAVKRVRQFVKNEILS